jgi:transketolase
MAAISQANMCLAGSHAGVSIGEDGPSQMALEDLASFRAVHGSTVLYPSCANQTARLVEEMAGRDGIVYLRTTRESLPVLYPADEPFPIGGSRLTRSSDSDDVTIVGAGITLHEALAAAETLAGEGISARVIDLYSVKPIDAATLAEAAEATGGIVVVEDHWPEGGLHEAVLEALNGVGVNVPVTGLAPTGMPTSGTPAELLDQAGIDRAHIAAAVRSLVGAKR